MKVKFEVMWILGRGWRSSRFGFTASVYDCVFTKKDGFNVKYIYSFKYYYDTVDTGFMIREDLKLY